MSTEKLGSKEKKAKGKTLVSENNNCFKFLFDYSQDFQITLDDEGKINQVNQAFKKIIGKNNGKLIGSYIYEFMPEVRGIIKKFRSQKIKKKRVSNIEIKLNRPEKPPLFCELLCMAFINKEGEKIIHLSGRDITERKRLQLNLIETDEKLEKKVTKGAKKLKKARSKVIQLKKLSIIGQSVVDVAHEIKNPLTTIKLIAQYLESISTDNCQTEQMQIILRNLNQIDRIVFSLLHLFQTSGFNFNGCNVNEILERINSTLGNSLPENIKIIKRYGSNIPQGWFDSTSLEQVFLNIVFNAIQAMPEGGELYINTSFDPVKNVIMIKFEDTGIGIPEGNLKKISKPYFTTFKGGNGLGLSICRSIIKKHKGTISIDSKLGKGTVVNIYLPIKKERDKNRTRVENNE